MELYVPLSCISTGYAWLLRFDAACAWVAEKSAVWVAVKCDGSAYSAQKWGW